MKWGLRSYQHCVLGHCIISPDCCILSSKKAQRRLAASETNTATEEAVSHRVLHGRLRPFSPVSTRAGLRLSSSTQWGSTAAALDQSGERRRDDVHPHSASPRHLVLSSAIVALCFHVENPTTFRRCPPPPKFASGAWPRLSVAPLRGMSQSGTLRASSDTAPSRAMGLPRHCTDLARRSNARSAVGRSC